MKNDRIRITEISAEKADIYRDTVANDLQHGAPVSFTTMIFNYTGKSISMSDRNGNRFIVRDGGMYRDNYRNLLPNTLEKNLRNMEKCLVVFTLVEYSPDVEQTVINDEHVNEDNLVYAAKPFVNKEKKNCGYTKGEIFPPRLQSSYGPNYSYNESLTASNNNYIRTMTYMVPIAELERNQVLYDDRSDFVMSTQVALQHLPKHPADPTRESDYYLEKAKDELGSNGSTEQVIYIPDNIDNCDPLYKRSGDSVVRIPARRECAGFPNNSVIVLWEEWDEKECRNVQRKRTKRIKDYSIPEYDKEFKKFLDEFGLYRSKELAMHDAKKHRLEVAKVEVDYKTAEQTLRKAEIDKEKLLLDHDIHVEKTIEKKETIKDLQRKRTTDLIKDIIMVVSSIVTLAMSIFAVFRSKTA